MALRALSTDTELLRIIKILESFIVRRLICGLSTRGYGTFFIDLMVAAIEKSQKKKSLYDCVAEFLSKSGAEGTRWPDDSEFQKAWTTLPLYEKLARPRLRFILRALEERLRTVGGLTEPFTVPTKLEIEHVMPQSWEANWPLPKGKTFNGTLADQRRETLHTIGNLTLLTKKLNITLSNAAWSHEKEGVPSKKRTIKEYSLMMLSKDIVDQSKWTEQSIKDRSEKLFKQAKALWPKT